MSITEPISEIHEKGLGLQVVVACGWPRPLGAVIHAGRLGVALEQIGCEVDAVALQPADGEPVAAGVLVSPVEIPSNAAPDEVCEISVSALQRLLSSFGPIDIGHAEDPVACAALLALRDAGQVKKVVTTVHHISVYDRGDVEDLLRRAVQESDATICASRWWAGHIRDEYGVEPRVVPHGVDAERFALPGMSRQEAAAVFGWGDRPVVLTVGGVKSRKGSRVALEAFARARAHIGTQALLVVAGPADHDDFQRQWYEDAERLGLVVTRGPAPTHETDVLAMGAVPGDRMPLLYRACDVLIAPSTREGFGLVPIEAAASGIPSVLSDIPVFLENFTNEVDCLTVPVGDARAVCQAMLRLFGDDELRSTVIGNATQRVPQFAWGHCARLHGEIYEDLLGVR